MIRQLLRLTALLLLAGCQRHRSRIRPLLRDARGINSGIAKIGCFSPHMPVWKPPILA
jgi:hypothetical protein